MQLLIKLLGLGRSFPLITGLLLFSVVGFTYNFFENRGIAGDAVRKAQSEAILKDTEENKQLSKEAVQIVEKAQNETEQTAKTVEAQIEAIKNLGPNKYLDVKLSDIGLQ